MKKIFLIMLVVSLALFSFVSCDDKKEPKPEPEVVSVYNGEFKISEVNYKKDISTDTDKTVANETPESDTVGTYKRDCIVEDTSKLQSDVEIGKDGKVTGTFAYVDLYDSHLFPCSKDGGQTEESEGYYVSFKNNKTDNTYLIFLGNDADAAKAKKLVLHDGDGNELVTLDFSGATFSPKGTEVLKVGKTENDVYVSGAKRNQ